MADMVQLCHNIRVHSVTEQPSGSCMFKLSEMQVGGNWTSFVLGCLYGWNCIFNLLQATVDACGLHHVTFNMGAFAAPTPILGYVSSIVSCLNFSGCVMFISSLSLVMQ